LVLFLVGLSWLFCNFLLIRKRKWFIRDVGYIVDLPVLAAVVFEILQLLHKILFSTEGQTIRFDIEITVIALAAVYWVITSGISLYKYYFDFILYTGLLLFGALLYRYLCDIRFGNVIAFIAEDEYAIAAYTVLICTIAVIQYCRCRDKTRSLFYGGVSLSGFLVLFINHNLVSICMMLAVFLAIPVLFRPVAEMVKRDMQMLFAYLFLLSNMSLVTNYTMLIRKELTLSIENSVWLDLLVAVGGILFFLYWDRIPKGMALDTLVLRKMRKGYLFFLKTMGLVFMVILTGGERWKALPDHMLLLPFKRLAVALCEEVKRGEPAVFAIFKNQGSIAGLLFIFFCSFIIARLRKNYHMDKPSTIVMILISDLFLVQQLFWKPNLSSLPVYFMILVFAAFYQEERRSVTVRKVKFLKE
jgi:hypothetical protein